MTKKNDPPARLLDGRGLTCPQPVLAAKEALEALAGGAIVILVDNEAAISNLERFGKSQGYAVTSSGSGELYRVRLEKAEGAEAAKPEDHLCAPPGRGLVILIPADSMGRGDEELGRVLLRAFVKTIKQLEPMPGKIFFYNNGVKLTATENDLVAPLLELVELGAEIYSCGACLDFFHLKESLKVGQVTNMYEIMAAMAGASKVVSPC